MLELLFENFKSTVLPGRLNWKDITKLLKYLIVTVS